MNKAIEKILNSALVIMLILNLISYQFILPISISRAEDTSGATTESAAASGSSDSGSSDSSDSDKEDASEEEESKEADQDKDVVEEDAGDEDEVDEEAAKEISTDESVIGEAVTEPEAELTLSTTKEVLSDTGEVLPVTQTQEAALPIVQNDSIENSETCACQNNSDENSDSEEENCPSDCACCQSYVNQINVAEDVASMTTADSISGGNIIAGELNPIPVNEVPANINEDNVQSDDGDDNEDDSDNSNEDGVDDSVEKSNLIATGDAVAVAVAVNEINTNVYSENGLEYERSINGNYDEDINLIEVFDDVIDNAQKLNEENEKAFEVVTVNIVNVAKGTKTAVLADANSGDNVVEALDSVAEIVTGSAEALASAVNFINTNIVGDNWVLAKINNFGNWTGDLIVPGEGLFDLPSGGMIFDKITNTNLAKNVASFISSDANSGDNSVSDAAGDVAVLTGDVAAASRGVNMVNTNIIKNNWFFLMINNAGNWTGQVFNWNNGNQELAYEYDFGSLEGVDAPVTKSVSVNNYNSAENVENTVLASADSGGNLISGVKGDATIMTGDAVARASAFNFINTNIVGNNWFMALINNAGTWSGDLVFGYPDLEADLFADKNSLQPGDRLNYTFNYRNSGQAKCGNVELMLSLPEQLIYQADSLGFSRRSGNDYYWQISGLDPGEQRTINLTVLLDPEITKDIKALESVAGVKTDTQEVNLENNYTADTIAVTFSQVTIQSGLPEKNGRLSVTRQEDASVAVGSISDHTIFVKNSGKDTLYNLEVKESIKNPAGEKMVEYIWPIEKLKKGEIATIQYQIFAGPELALGNYRHTASAKAMDQYGREVESDKASTLVAFSRPAFEVSVSDGVEDNPVISNELDSPVESAGTLTPEILGVTNEKNFAWQWLLLLMLIPFAYYAKREKVYRWETIQKFSRQMGSFLSSFL